MFSSSSLAQAPRAAAATVATPAVLLVAFVLCLQSPATVAVRVDSTDGQAIVAATGHEAEPTVLDRNVKDPHKCHGEKPCGAEYYAGGIKIGSSSYKVDPLKCLADCEPLNPSAKCSDVKKTKVAKHKNGDKLCCAVQKCTYVPLKDSYEQMLLKGELQRKPLKPMTHYMQVRQGTCVCCKQPVEEWDAQVSHLCKKAYTAEPKTIFGGLSLFKNKCKNYCSEFPGYGYAKKALAAHHWVKQKPSAPEVLGTWTTHSKDGSAGATWTIEESSLGTYDITSKEVSGAELKGELFPIGEFLVADLAESGGGPTVYSVQLRAPPGMLDYLYAEVKARDSDEYGPRFVAFRDLPECTREQLKQENKNPGGCFDMADRCRTPTHLVRRECPVTCKVCLTVCEKGTHDKKHTGQRIQGKPASCTELRAAARCVEPDVQKACPESCRMCFPYSKAHWE